MSVFIDTSAILATIDADDQMHADAVRVWRDLLESGEHMVTSNYVVLETIALLKRRFGGAVARRFAQDAMPAIEVVWVDQPLHELALAAALAVDGKRSPSLVDCVSFELMRRESISRVFAYDRHFGERGYTVLG